MERYQGRNVVIIGGTSAELRHMIAARRKFKFKKRALIARWRE